MGNTSVKHMRLLSSREVDMKNILVQFLFGVSQKFDQELLLPDVVHRDPEGRGCDIISIFKFFWIKEIQSEMVNRMQDVSLTVHFLYQCHMFSLHAPAPLGD